jgi:hypothetical protein
MVIEGSDGCEGAIEILKLSEGNRQDVAETLVRLRDMRQDGDTARASEIVRGALRRGDEAQCWLNGLRSADAGLHDGSDGRASSPSAARERVPGTVNGENPGSGPVAAHLLLNSSAVVSMGISTLRSMWDGLAARERQHLLAHMAVHATAVDDALRLLTMGHDAAVVSAHPPNGSAPQKRGG